MFWKGLNVPLVKLNPYSWAMDQNLMETENGHCPLGHQEEEYITIHWELDAASLDQYGMGTSTLDH